MLRLDEFGFGAFESWASESKTTIMSLQARIGGPVSYGENCIIWDASHHFF